MQSVDIVGLADELLDPARRRSAVTALAERLGVDDLVIFLRDPEVGVFLPAPGFSRRLSNGQAWQAFLAGVAEQRVTSDRLGMSGDAGPRLVRGVRAGDDACCVLLGDGEPSYDLQGFLQLLPLIVRALAAQRAAIHAASRADVARHALERAEVLAVSLDTARTAVQDALHKASERSHELALAHATLQEQAAELELINETLQEQSLEMEAQAEELQAINEASARREARYRALVDATINVVWLTDDRGNLIEGEDGWAAFTGLAAEQCQALGWTEAIHPEDRSLLVEQWNHAAGTGSGSSRQLRVRRFDGLYRLLAVRSVRVRGEGNRVPEWVYAGTDITDAVHTEQQLRQVQKLQSMGTFAGGMAHEVNNQMTVVIGCGRFALNAMDPRGNAAADVRQMIIAAERTARVAQQLLAFSRRQVTLPRRLEIGPLLAELSPLLARLLGSDKTLAIRPGAEPSFVEADPTQLEQVFINLAANARDAMSTGGRLTVTTEHVVLTEQYGRVHGGIQVRPGPYVLIAVSDDGAGMDRDTLERVFEPFFTTKGVGQGTGLGLSMVYGIVKQHGGFVWAYSEVGYGTVIKVYLPLAGTLESQPMTGEPPPSAPEPAMAGAHILVVEDDPAVRAITRRTLETAGYVVTEAGDGREALVLLEEALPDVVVTDIIMPQVNGREVAEAFLARSPGAPILFTSGYAGDDDIVRGLLPRGAPFLQKPFAPEHLLSAIRDLVPSRPPPPADAS